MGREREKIRIPDVENLKVGTIPDEKESDMRSVENWILRPNRVIHKTVVKLSTFLLCLALLHSTMLASNH